jgi:polysaccharide biosynthesis protein PslJ
VTFGMSSRTEAATAIGVLLVCPVVVALAVVGGQMVTLAVAGLIALLISVYIGLRHPLWLFWGLAAVVGALPFGYFPGVHVPLYLPFAAGALLAAVVHESNNVPFHPLEKAVVLLLLASGVSLIFTGRDLVDVTVFVRWVIATLVMIALLRLSRDNLARFGRIYVYAATANALFGIAIVAADPNHRFIKLLSIFNYDREDTGRFVFTDEGASRFTRLGGTWVDPNIAGIGLVPALVMGIVLLKGKMRLAVTAILSAAIVLTLSRAAIFSVLMGIALVALFHTMRSRHRLVLFSSVAFAVVGALLVPAVRTRILSSFGSDDTGAQDRSRALAQWPHLMSGHWPFGLGWGRREFVDGAFAFNLNFVSNSPLIAIYRAGIIVGLIFIAILVMGCIMSYRALRSDSLPAAIYGGVFIGFCVVALQLDHPVVDIPQSVIAFGFFLAFLVYVDRSRQLPSSTQSLPTDTGEFVADRPDVRGAPAPAT